MKKKKQGPDKAEALRYENICKTFSQNAPRSAEGEDWTIFVPSRPAQMWVIGQIERAEDHARAEPEGALGGMFFLGLLAGIFLSEIGEGQFITREK